MIQGPGNKNRRKTASTGNQPSFPIAPAEKLVFNILLDLDQARSLKSEILNRIRTVVFLAIILEIT
jgi:hypothetical protein